jgi:hypothetical protein
MAAMVSPSAFHSASTASAPIGQPAPALRIWRSWRSRFGDGNREKPGSDLEDEVITSERVYDDFELQRIAEEGFNGIWVHGILRHLVSVDPFPELGENAPVQQAALERLIARAARHGLKVWLYLQPPRAVPVSWSHFWETHPDIGGEEMEVVGSPGEPDSCFRSLCTSTQPVKQWIHQASAELAKRFPELGGVILITSSEFPSHCYTHRTRYEPTEWCPTITCPRCADREPEEVASEVVTLVHSGIASQSETIQVIAWNWSWAWRDGSYERTIAGLPKEVILMGDYERGGFRDLPGRRGFLLDEYSLAYSGPSERYQRCALAAKNRGMRVMAKLQLGTTHELASVVSLPMIGSLYDKAVALVKDETLGFMGCWNFGNYPSTNTAAFIEFLRQEPGTNKETVLENFARDRFPGCSPQMTRRAWELLETAMLYFPFTIAFLYHGAHPYTLAYREIYHPGDLTGKPSGRSWLGDERGDDLSNSYLLHHTQFNLDEIIDRLEHLAKLWDCGVRLLTEALAGAEGKEARLELGNAVICGAIWQSTYHTYKIFRLRKAWSDAARSEYLKLASAEEKLLKTVLPWVEADERQGIHLEPQVRMFGPESIRQKISHLQSQLSSPE